MYDNTVTRYHIKFRDNGQTYKIGKNFHSITLEDDTNTVTIKEGSPDSHKRLVTNTPKRVKVTLQESSAVHRCDPIKTVTNLTPLCLWSGSWLGGFSVS